MGILLKSRFIANVKLITNLIIIDKWLKSEWWVLVAGVGECHLSAPPALQTGHAGPSQHVSTRVSPRAPGPSDSDHHAPASQPRGPQHREPWCQASLRWPALQLQQAGETSPEHHRPPHCQNQTQTVSTDWCGKIYFIYCLRESWNWKILSCLVIDDDMIIVQSMLN